MAQNVTPKHVIFLGAGASHTSGYPLANDLRQLLVSEEKVRNEIEKTSKLNKQEIDLLISPMFGGSLDETVKLFREGCFSTVDQFSSVAGLRFPKEVQELKKRVRFALGLHNPEEKFQDSDYYPFIEKLFHEGLFPLRNDIAILTFNYDPYLAFLLDRAVKVRCHAAGKPQSGDCQGGLTSGFFGRTLGSLESGNELCLLHLHGIIAWPEKHDHESVVTFRDLFCAPIEDRLTKLHSQTLPPILFPWEIINDKGELPSKFDFCLTENVDERGARPGGYTGPNDLHALFVSIWKRAQNEVRLASKISFVGLSMHEFLNPSLRFLFRRKQSDAQIVVVNKEFENAKKDEIFSNPLSPVYKLRKHLKLVWPRAVGPSVGDGEVNVDIRATFKEFIQYEMASTGSPKH